MDSYSRLVSRILKNDVLAKEVASMNDPAYLNLVCLDWQSLLDNDIGYQDFVAKGDAIWSKPSTKINHYTIEKIKSLGDDFGIYFVAPGRFSELNNKRQTIRIEGLGPLIQIGNAICPYTKIAEGTNLSFNFGICGICIHCKEQSIKFTAAGYQLKQFQPCIAKTKVFDGRYIMNRFHCVIENLDEFLALVRLKINTRYTYIAKDGIMHRRFSGTVKDIVVLLESSLEDPTNIFLGELPPPPLPDDEPLAKKAKTTSTLAIEKTEEGLNNA